MFKNIVPNLVSFDTELRKIRGFYFSDNFQFYTPVETKNTLHYKVFIDNKITVPNVYDFRSGYFLKYKNKWYYERKIGIFTLKFCFDPQNKSFSFNRLYSLIPFEIGQIFPVGRHIADLINLELFLKEYAVFRGCAFDYQNKTICIIAPGLNGKTSLIKKLLAGGGKYIAEDLLVINFKENKVYPSNIRTDFFARKINKEISTIIKDKIVGMPKNIDRLFLIQNSTNSEYDAVAKNIFDYLNLCSLDHIENPFVRGYIFEENLLEPLINSANKIKQIKTNYDFKNVKNFNFNFLD